MNIMSYLTSPAFEEFADAPVGQDQLMHNQAAPAGEVPVATPAAEAPADNLEIPESAGPALVATADEAQAAAIVDDPGHSEAEQAAQAATAEDTAVIEQAEVAPGETSETTEVVEESTADGTVEETGEAEVADVSGEGELGDETGETSTGADDLGTDGDAGADAGSELGDDAGGDGAGDLGGDTTTEDGLGETESTGDETETGDTEVEEDGLGDDLGSDEGGGEDGLGDGAGGDTETGETETNGDDLEAEGSGETEEESTGEAETESEASGEETGGEEEGGEETDAEAETDTDEGDGAEVDIPDVDEEATEEEADAAEDEAEEAAEEDEELEDEIIDTSKSIDELEGEEASVEEFIQVLALGCQRKSFNVQTVALAQSKLQSLSKRFGRYSPVIPSMEDYTAQNLDSYYTNSLESFSSFLKKIRHVRDSFIDDFAKSMNDKMHLKAVETQIAAINTACDVQINRMKDLTLEGKVSVSVPAAIRGSGGVVKAVTKELSFLNDFAGIFAHDSKFLTSLVGLLSQAVKEGDAVKSTSTIQKALKLPLPVKSYPASVFSGSELTTFALSKSGKAATGSMVADMKTLGDRAIPTHRGDVDKEIKLDDDDRGEAKQEVTKADLVKMLRLAKVIIGLSRGTAGISGKKIVESMDLTNRAKTERNQSDTKSGDKSSQGDNGKAMDNMVKALLDATWNSADNYAAFQWHLIGIADALVHCVKRVKGSKK